jgi:hypothetical protein
MFKCPGVEARDAGCRAAGEDASGLLGDSHPILVGWGHPFQGHGSLFMKETID